MPAANESRTGGCSGRRPIYKMDAEAGPDDVFLTCIRQGGKLRVRIVSPGYLNDANCQFPRAIRAEGRMYRTSASSVRLAASSGGKYFYRVHGDIETLDESAAEESPAKGPAKEKKTKKRPKPAQVFDNGDPECVICLEAPKTRILVPCGHFCLCDGCNAKLVQKKCPLCRQGIQTAITREEMG